VSTISIEEKIPFNVSDATRLAPEEIYLKPASALKKSKEEMQRMNYLFGVLILFRCFFCPFINWIESDRKKERKTRKAAKKRKNDEIEKKLVAREKENPMDMSKERAIKKIKQAGEKVCIRAFSFRLIFSSYSLERYLRFQYRNYEILEF
jgi:hypothetical protein